MKFNLKNIKDASMFDYHIIAKKDLKDRYEIELLKIKM